VMTDLVMNLFRLGWLDVPLRVGRTGGGGRGRAFGAVMLFFFGWNCMCVCVLFISGIFFVVVDMPCKLTQ